MKKTILYKLYKFKLKAWVALEWILFFGQS